MRLNHLNNNNLMSVISKVKGREILDSRGNPTVEVDITLSSGTMGRMMVPSGASTGKFEAWELRDGGKRYRGLGVQKAVHHVNTIIRDALIGQNAYDQIIIDKLLIEIDGSTNKKNLGANALLGASLATAHAAASENNEPLYKYLASLYKIPHDSLKIPLPMINIISGGLHAGKNLEIQDFLVVPLSPKTYSSAIEMVSNVYHATKHILKEKGYTSNLIADEGGFGPNLSSNKEALDILCEAFEHCGYKPKQDIAIALDVAASHFYNEETKQYYLHAENKKLNAFQMTEMLQEWINNYPIISIEDGLAEDDWEGWKYLNGLLGKQIQIVGDDLFTTNPERITKGISLNAANAVLIKMNQIGTLTETFEAVTLAKQAGFKTVISARSGETEDATLAHLAVGLHGGQIKIGSLARSSRLSKYNQLLRIEEDLHGRYFGSEVFL